MAEPILEPAASRSPSENDGSMAPEDGGCTIQADLGLTHAASCTAQQEAPRATNAPQTNSAPQQWRNEGVVGEPGSEGYLGLRLVRKSKEQQGQAILGQLPYRLEPYLPTG